MENTRVPCHIFLKPTGLPKLRQDQHLQGAATEGPGFSGRDGSWEILGFLDIICIYSTYIFTVYLIYTILYIVLYNMIV